MNDSFIIRGDLYVAATDFLFAANTSRAIGPRVFGSRSSSPIMAKIFLPVLLFNRSSAVRSEMWKREGEIRIINDALLEHPQYQSSVHFFHVVSGIGKSRICE